MIYDLHVHSTASDGVLTPQEIIDAAADIGLLGLAITDHDTTGGLEIAIKHKKEKEIKIDFIPGIELNTEMNGSEIHILGYFIDYKNKHLGLRLEEIKNARYERAYKMVDKLRRMGLNISFEQVNKFARGDLIGRPHIAQALMTNSYVFSIKEAFNKFIGQGKPAYVPRYKFLPEEAIELIKGADGIPVLAHPGLIKDQSQVGEIIDMGIEGIEVFYPEHQQCQITEYTKLGLKNDLLLTGGSDFHGTVGSDTNRSRLGCTGIDIDLMRKICDKKNRNK